MWLTALNSVEGLLFWVDDVWAAQAGGCGFYGCIYAGWKPPPACCNMQWPNCTIGCPGQPQAARQGPGAWVHRTYANGTCMLAGQRAPASATDPRPMCDWREATMYTDGLCSSIGGTLSNGDGSWMFPGPDGLPLSSIRLENLRDGIEDLEMLKKLPAERRAKLLKPVLANGNKCVSQAPWSDARHRCVDWQDDPAALERVRRQAARLLIDASAAGRAG